MSENRRIRIKDLPAGAGFTDAATGTPFTLLHPSAANFARLAVVGEGGNYILRGRYGERQLQSGDMLPLHVSLEVEASEISYPYCCCEEVMP